MRMYLCVHACVCDNLRMQSKQAQSILNFKKSKFKTRYDMTCSVTFKCIYVYLGKINKYIQTDILEGIISKHELVISLDSLLWKFSFSFIS